MHNDSAMPFARTVDRIATPNELIATAEFDMEDPMGATVFRKIAAGFVNATSVPNGSAPMRLNTHKSF